MGWTEVNMFAVLLPTKTGQLEEVIRPQQLRYSDEARAGRTKCGLG
jgi:hypothetical protein